MKLPMGFIFFLACIFLWISGLLLGYGLTYSLLRPCP